VDFVDGEVGRTDNTPRHGLSCEWGKAEQRTSTITIFFAVFGILLVMAGALLGMCGWRNLQRASWLGIPLVRIAKLAPGHRKVRGHIVAAGETLRAPVTNKPCVYYRLRVKQERRRWKTRGGPGAPSGGLVIAGVLGGAIGGALYSAVRAARADDNEETKLIRSWEEVLNEASNVRLVVQDDTGTVEVDMHDAEVIPKEKSQVLTDFDKAAPTHLQDLLRKKYRFETVDEGGKLKTLHFLEEMLAEGTRVTVVGPVEAGSDGNLLFQAAGGPLLVSEPDVGKMSRSARRVSIGFSVAAVGTTTLGLVAMALSLALSR
jgi:hypothetical protein